MIRKKILVKKTLELTKRLMHYIEVHKEVFGNFDYPDFKYLGQIKQDDVFVMSDIFPKLTYICDPIDDEFIIKLVTDTIREVYPENVIGCAVFQGPIICKPSDWNDTISVDYIPIFIMGENVIDLTNIVNCSLIDYFRYLFQYNDSVTIDVDNSEFVSGLPESIRNHLFENSTITSGRFEALLQESMSNVPVIDLYDECGRL